jgi:hypothetical protein
MIVIGLTTQVNTDAELTALTGMVKNKIVWHTGDSCAYTYEPNFGSGDVDSIDGGVWVKDLILALDLDGYKALRIEEIKERTKEIIAMGFVYNGVNFSLSQDAQIGLVALDEVRDDPLMTYPQAYGNIDSTQIYNITDSTDLHTMYFTALGTKKHWLETEDVLKQQIIAGVDELAVEAIIDNR